MKRLLKIILTAGFLLFVARKGHCQLILSTADDLTQNQLFITMGLEPEVVTTIGYTHLLDKQGGKLDYRLGASLKFAPLVLSNSPWRANLIGSIDWRKFEKWGAGFTLNLYNAHDHNRAGVMNGLGYMLRVTPVSFCEKWVKGFDLGWQQTVLTRIRHSTEAQDAFNDRYPPGTEGIEGPNDGWYSGTASRFRLGFLGETKIGDRLRLQVGLGGLINVQKQGILLGFSHAQFPFYMECILAYNW